MTKRLAVIDGKSVFYRGYFAMPNLSLPDGTPTGGVYGFAALALEVIKKLEPDYVAVAWDKKGTSIRKRVEIHPDYKAGRKAPPEDFQAQIPILHELLEAFSWPLYELDDYEADDIMGALAQQASDQGIETYLITSDLDMLQVVGPLTHVYALKKGLTNIEEYNVSYFEDKYGISVHQFLDLKALQGDSSDNIPGVPGVGQKTGLALLKEYGTLDNIYDSLDTIKPTVAKKLEAGKESAYMSKEIARIWCDAPVSLDLKAMDVHDLDVDHLAKLLRQLEFHSLLRRLPKTMQVTSGQASLFGEVAQSAIMPFEVGSWPETLALDADNEALLHISPDLQQVWLSTKRQDSDDVADSRYR
jgi:DNA polymerase I